MKKLFYRILLIPALAFILVSCEKRPAGETTESAAPEKPTRVILMIGDGMGLAQVSTTVYFKKDGPSNFQRFTHIGLINTSAADAKVTDSAAGATAFACGVLTYNGAIGVNTSREPVTNIIELLSRSGFRTGLVATSSITHATPACFYAHVVDRNMNEEIAGQLPGSDVDIFMGGGRKFFENRTDNVDMIQRLRDSGFNIYFSTDELPALDASEKYGVLAAPDGLPPVYQGRGTFLRDATEKALNYLSAGQEPFFLMVEGSQIDWGGHENNAEYLISEMLDFDSTIGAVLDFAEKTPGTLVVVTADHETGGFALSAGAGNGMNADYDEINPTFSTGGHTATLIPVFATGPGADLFSGIYKNTAIHDKIVEAIGDKN